MCLRRLIALTLLLIAPAVTADALEQPLHVLLTNDDGYQAPGIVAAHAALVAAGFRVSVAAPRDQQSGSSMRVSIGEITVAEIDENFWAVDGTPADAVSWALNTALRDDRPDIVVSGLNFGQNLGGNTNLSGTVGAAIMATQLGVPAIAVSVGIDLEERSASPDRFPSTAAAFPVAARFTAELVNELTRSRADGAPILPPHRLLNVNYPALPAAKIKGVRTTRVAHVGGFNARFAEPDADGRVRIDLAHGDPVDPLIAAGDTELFAAGYITVSMLDGSLDAGADAASALRRRLSGKLEASVKDAGKDPAVRSAQ